MSEKTDKLLHALQKHRATGRAHYTMAELDAFALDDLRRDAEQCEKQAVDGPFYPDRDITAESLGAYAARCREVMAECAGGGAHSRVLAGIIERKRT